MKVFLVFKDNVYVLIFLYFGYPCTNHVQINDKPVYFPIMSPTKRFIFIIQY